MLSDLVQIDHSPKLLYFIQDLVKIWLLSHSFAVLSIDNLNEYITSVYNDDSILSTWCLDELVSEP